MIKKIFLFIATFFIFGNIVLADNEILTSPTGSIILNANFQSPYTITNRFYCLNSSAVQFCSDYGGEYVSHTCLNTGGIGQNLYYFTNGSYWSNTTTPNNRIETITCNMPNLYITPVTETFIDFSYEDFNYELTTFDTGSGVLSDYTKEFSDISKMLFQIKIILIINGFFVLLFVFTSLINDLLGKR